MFRIPEISHRPPGVPLPHPGCHCPSRRNRTPPAPARTALHVHVVQIPDTDATTLVPVHTDDRPPDSVQPASHSHSAGDR
jgi:hypothetical protein